MHRRDSKNEAPSTENEPDPWDDAAIDARNAAQRDQKKKTAAEQAGHDTKEDSKKIQILVTPPPLSRQKSASQTQPSAPKPAHVPQHRSVASAPSLPQIDLKAIELEVKTTLQNTQNLIKKSDFTEEKPSRAILQELFVTAGKIIDYQQARIDTKKVTIREKMHHRLFSKGTPESFLDEKNEIRFARIHILDVARQAIAKTMSLGRFDRKSLHAVKEKILSLKGPFEKENEHRPLDAEDKKILNDEKQHYLKAQKSDDLEQFIKLIDTTLDKMPETGPRKRNDS